MHKLIFAAVLFFSFSLSANAEVSYWQTKKSQHFVVYYQEAKEAFVDDLVAQAENYYNSIVDELGFRRMDFWSWENRAKIYLFNSSSDYQKDTKSASWSGAQVSIKKRTIKTFVGQDSFLDSILSHEMTHMIFREFIGLKTALPLWIDEGVACSQEKSNLRRRMDAAKTLIEQDTYLEFNRLFDVYSATLIVPDIFYAQSASVIIFLLNRYGKEQFLDFSRKLRDGVNWQKALLETYRFNSVEDMQAAWKDFMLNKS